MTVEPGQRYRYKKRGTIYKVVAIGTLQASGVDKGLFDSAVKEAHRTGRLTLWKSLRRLLDYLLKLDDARVVIYHKACPWGSRINLAEAAMWVRPLSEFTDGRFEEVE